MDEHKIVFTAINGGSWDCSITLRFPGGAMVVQGRGPTKADALVVAAQSWKDSSHQYGGGGGIAVNHFVGGAGGNGGLSTEIFKSEEPQPPKS